MVFNIGHSSYKSPIALLFERNPIAFGGLLPIADAKWGFLARETVMYSNVVKRWRESTVVNKTM